MMAMKISFLLLHFSRGPIESYTTIYVTSLALTGCYRERDRDGIFKLLMSLGINQRNQFRQPM